MCQNLLPTENEYQMRENLTAFIAYKETFAILEILVPELSTFLITLMNPRFNTVDSENMRKTQDGKLKLFSALVNVFRFMASMLQKERAVFFCPAKIWHFHMLITFIWTDFENLSEKFQL